MRDRIWPRLLIEFEKGARGTSQLPMRRGRPNLRGRESDPARDERRESRPAVANSGRDVSETLLSAVSMSAVPSVGQAVVASIDMFAIDKKERPKLLHRQFQQRTDSISGVAIFRFRRVPKRRGIRRCIDAELGLGCGAHQRVGTKPCPAECAVVVIPIRASLGPRFLDEGFHLADVQIGS